VWLALSDDAAGLSGEYIEDEKVVAPSAQAQDDSIARRESRGFLSRHPDSGSPGVGSQVRLPCRVMPMIVAVIVVSWVAFVGFSVTERSDFPWRQRRSHFWARVALTCLLAPLWLLLLFVLVDVNLVPVHPILTIFWCTCVAVVPAAALAPALFFRRSSQPPDGSEGDGGSDPDPSPAPPAPPRGGIPRPDAELGHWRLRDHDRPETHDPIERRPAHEPDRTPTIAK
jgi:hypothetical protein